MENQKPRIEFYRQRSFSDKLNVTFDFIRENWLPLLKYSFYLITPVCLIQSLAMNSITKIAFSSIKDLQGDSPFGFSMLSFFVNYGALLFCMLIGYAIMSGFIYAMMQTYAVRENRLQDVTLSDFKDLLVKNAWKYIRLLLAFIFVFILIVMFMGLLAGITVWSLTLTIPLLLFSIVCIIPLILVIPAYIFERDITFSEALRKGWKLGFATMGGVFGLVIVLYLISYVITTVTSLPWNVATIAGTIFSFTSEAVIRQSVFYKFALYLLGLLQAYGMYLSSVIGVVGVAFQYFHAREKVEGVTFESNISNFGNL